MSVSIGKNIASIDQPATVQLLTLLRKDTSTPPAGVSLPLAFTDVAGTWTATFTDTGGTCELGYSYTYQLNWGDNSYSGPFPDGTPAIPNGTLPIAEQIDLSMLAAIQSISTGNGYQINFSSVVRWNDANVPTPADMQAIVYLEGDTVLADNDTPMDQTPIGDQQFERNYSVRVYILKPPGGSPALPTWRNIVRAEIERAVLADRQRAVPSGIQYAQDTYDRGWDLAQDAAGLDLILVYFTCRYRFLENNPYAMG